MKFSWVVRLSTDKAACAAPLRLGDVEGTYLAWIDELLCENVRRMNGNAQQFDAGVS